MRTSKNINIKKAVILFYDQIIFKLLSSSLDVLLQKIKVQNKVQKRALRLITNDYQSSFNILLGECNEFSIHQRNLQTLMIKSYTKLLHQL